MLYIVLDSVSRYNSLSERLPGKVYSRVYIEHEDQLLIREMEPALYKVWRIIRKRIVGQESVVLYFLCALLSVTGFLSYSRLSKAIVDEGY